MRTWWIATAGLLLGTAGGAEAQRVATRDLDGRRPGASYPAPGQDGASSATIQPWQAPRGGVRGPRAGDAHQLRWGSKVDGRWSGGADAPGGWNGYRRPFRGYALPIYWIAPRFRISDWQAYGLSRPMPGYQWARYYDDAVLIDARGSVFDTREGIDWDGDRADGYARDERGSDMRRYDDRDYDDRGYDDEGDEDRRYADRRDRRDVPVAPDRAPPPPVGYAPGDGPWRSADGTTTVITSSGGSGYYRGGAYHPGAASTTVVVQSAPAVTTTTTDTYEDAVTYTRRPAVRKKTRRLWRPVPR